ncbi:MAG: GTPase Era [Armatimonadota bacterium]|nr:GTPase Era [Armatimonadota bacterium]MDR7443165.1 GTPase Era [Armatimonadota bacterium]MDR7571150.1 GTPase Era [Armatimonadota bacterium]MDR7614618.1 GTPase Era [Armatimonadota bacterium]
MSVFRSGFIALLGPPNAGKSTLTNALVGTKVAIVTPIPQTTRTAIRGVVHLPHAQMVLVDTPGVHSPKHRLGEHMMRTARAALQEADAVLLVLDVSRPVGPETEMAVALARQSGRPVVVALNKCDLASPREIEAREAWVRAELGEARVVRTSALRGQGLPELVEILVGLLPPGPRYFEEEDLTDQPLQRLVAELIREKAMERVREEVPHAVGVEIEEFREKPEEGLTYIRATLHVEKPSHKPILIGKGGRMIREIGTAARKEIEALLGTRVYLDLWVKVSEDWRDDERMIRALYPS